jgi:hypothetical protein
MLKKIILGFTFLMLIGGCTSIDKAHYEYDATAYNTVAPALRKYVEADPTLNDTQKKDREGALDEWHNVINSNLGIISTATAVNK